jgi:hypothetical protein
VELVLPVIKVARVLLEQLEQLVKVDSKVVQV